MRKNMKILFMLLVAALLLTGCGLRTVDELYCLPKRSEAYDNLQSVIDKAMNGLEYATPIYGENRQVVQMADLDGDGTDEYLLFAKDNSEKPLKILIFCQLAAGYVLMDTIEGYGFAYDFVQYAQMDDRPGVELIVGRQLSEQMVRAVSVYRFTSGFSRQLLSTGYARLVTCDLDGDGMSEMFLLHHGESEDSDGTAALYRYEDGEIQRSAQLSISEPAANFRRISAASLADGTPAVFVTCAASEKALTTDIFALQDDRFVAVKKGITVETLKNYYIYPTDMNADGVLDLPELIPMQMPEDAPEQQYLIRWYALDAAGLQQQVFYTYHDTADRWYLRLEGSWIQNISVVESEKATAFYMKTAEERQKLFTITVLTDADRQEQAMQEDRIVLFSSDAVIYVADLGPAAADYGITETNLPARFMPIRVDMNTEED